MEVGLKIEPWLDAHASLIHTSTKAGDITEMKKVSKDKSMGKSKELPCYSLRLRADIVAMSKEPLSDPL